MTSYATSTQRKQWTFTVDSLATSRRRALDAAALAARPAGNTHTAALLPPAPSAEQVLLLQRYYTAKAKEVATALQLPGKVFRTTSLLLARCCLDATVLLHFDLRAVMLACLYVACKAEERYVSADTLAAAVGGAAAAGGTGSCSGQGVLNAEVAILKACGFSLVTHHAHRAAHGFVAAAAEQQEAPRGVEGQAASPLSELRGRALARCDALFLCTDAPLLHSPGALGLAAVVHAARGTVWEPAVGAIAARVANQHGHDVIRHALDAVHAALACPPPDAEAVKAADRVCKSWRSALMALVKKAQAQARTSGGGGGGGGRPNTTSDVDDDGPGSVTPGVADDVPVPTSGDGRGEGDEPEPKRRRSETPMKDATPSAVP